MGDRVREIVFDLCGGMLTQDIAERIINEANAPGDEAFVTITFKRISRFHPVPRLIVDYGDVLHRVIAEIERREKEKP